jgi:hypothetical protein
MADTPQIYFTTLTAIGEAKDANAKALGTALKFTEMAVGDGNGALPVPDRTRTSLVRQVRRAPLNTLKADPANPGQVIAEQIIPEDVGGWWIRELGLYDDAGDLVAIGNCPETYKPQLAQGSGRTQVVRMVLIMSSAATVQLKVDPSVVLATRKYADEQDALVRQAATDQDAAHVAAQDPHPQYLTEAEGAARIQAAVTALVNAAPATLDTLAEIATALGNDKNFSTTITNALALKAPKDSPAFTGNVGVGTAAPKARLHVDGGNLVVSNGGNVTNAGGAVCFSALAGSTAPMAAIFSSLRWAGGGEEQGDILFSTRPITSTTGQALIERLRITAGGNVGVGTDSPGTRLHVAGRTTLGLSGTSGQYAMTFPPDTAGKTIFHLKNDSDGIAWLSGGDAYTSFSELMRLTAGGRFGIGTSGPTSKLEVRADDKVNPPTILLHNRGINGADSASYYVGGLWGAAFRDVTNPAHIAGIDFLRTTASNGLSSLGSILFYTGEGSELAYSRGNYEKMRLDYNGNLLVGKTSGANHIIRRNGAGVGQTILTMEGDTGLMCAFYAVDTWNANATRNAFSIGSQSTTGRSINAGGTVNTGGNDYAEYYRKADGCAVVAKGDIVGVDADGHLTDKWASAVSFLVKSTKPSYVGGDTWGTAEAIGMPEPVVPVFSAPDYAGAPHPGDAPIEPAAPIEPEAPLNLEAYNGQMEKYKKEKIAYDAALAAFQSDNEAHQAQVNDARLYFDAITMPAYQGERATFDAKLEAARQKVDRIAYCGQVPVNVKGAKPGQYVVPVQDGDGIAGQLVDDAAITFEQYRRAVGIVQNVLEDGRANVRVKPV